VREEGWGSDAIATLAVVQAVLFRVGRGRASQRLKVLCVPK